MSATTTTSRLDCDHSSGSMQQSHHDFRALDIGFEVQRSLANKLVSNSKTVTKSFIDETSAQLLDQLYRLIKVYTKNKKESEKVLRNLIKIAVKVGLLSRSGRLATHEQRQLISIQKQVHTLAISLISFHQVDHTYDRHYLLSRLRDLRSSLGALMASHLTDKSCQRLEFTMDFFMAESFLDALYVDHINDDMARQKSKFFNALSHCVDEGSL